MKRLEIFHEINQERDRQEMIHPFDPSYDHEYFFMILSEEIGEVATELLEGRDNLKEELIQVASVCIRWLEHFQEMEQNRND